MEADLSSGNPNPKVLKSVRAYWNNLHPFLEKGKNAWEKLMLLLRDLSDNDMSTISRWPSCPLGFEELDYALRVNGWLTVEIPEG